MQCPSCNQTMTYIVLKKPDKIPLEKYCMGCGVQIFSRIGGYYECTFCKLSHLCSNCRLCPEGHFLSRVYFLNDKGPSLYSQNKFSCDVCHVSQTTPKKGVLHCNECEWDICEFCLGEKELNFQNLEDF